MIKSVIIFTVYIKNTGSRSMLDILIFDTTGER